MKKLFILSLIIQLVLISFFLIFVWQSDQAMDKSGVGDLEKWNEFNKYAGIALYSGVIIWFLIIITASIKKLFGKNYAQRTIAIPPLFLIFGWVSLWFV